MTYHRAIASMRNSLADELLPYHELKEALSVLSGRIDAGVAKKLEVLRAFPLSASFCRFVRRRRA